MGTFVMKLLSPLTYPQKFIFISCLFGFSILVSAYFMLRAQNYSIHFAKMELDGIQYEKSIRQLLEDIPNYYLGTQHPQQANANSSKDQYALQAQINTNFKALLAIDQELEKTLSTTSQDFQMRETSNIKPAEIERQWSELSQQTPGSQQAAALFKSIMQELQALMVYIGDTSHLITDPEIHTYYLIQNALMHIPEAQNLIFQMLSKVQEPSEKKDTALHEQEDLTALLILLRSTLKASKKDIDNVFALEKSLSKDLNTQIKLKEPFFTYMTQANAFLDYVDKNKNIPEKLPEMRLLAQKALNAGFVYWDMVVDQIEKLIQDRLNKYRFEQLLSSLISILGAIAGFLVGFLTMRGISHPLTHLIGAAKNLSAGNLAARVPISYKDEVGQVGEAFNQMAESFQKLIGQLQWTGIQLTTSSTELAATAKQQETTIIEQEAATKQIAATAREISATSKDFAKTMNEVSSGAEETSSLAAAGKEGLTRMESIMRQMVDAAGNIASKLAVLNEKAGSITSIITTIAKVADQTNLLSLNTAIEAEKAGEYGRSFAVIAREIRRLADQTANATVDIEKMVNEMVSAVSAGVMGVDKFSEEIHTGVKQVSTVGEQLSKIIEQVQQQTGSFEAVNQGMQAQSLGAEQINDSINQLSEAAQQTSDSIRQFHNAIEQLNNAAQEMQNTVSKLKR